MKFPTGLAVLVAVALTAAACGGARRVTGSSGQAPTTYGCAAAWDRDAPRSVLAWERRSHVWEATVAGGKASESTVSWGTGQKVTTTGQQAFRTCQVVLFATPRRATILSGRWVRGSVPSWGRPLRGKPFPGGGNACVARDGTIHRVGAYTAGTRCPRTA